MGEVPGAVKVRLHFEPRDCWVGVYWDHNDLTNEVYICVLPLLPLHISWPREWWR